MADAPAVCTAPPSAASARDLVYGRPGGLLATVASYLGRAAIVGASMYVAGKREDLGRDALAGTAVIEGAILAHFALARARGVPAEACPDLPTSRRAARLMAGDWSALPAVALDTGVRALELAAGAYLAGAREGLARDAVAGAVGVTGFLLVNGAAGAPR